MTEPATIKAKVAFFCPDTVEKLIYSASVSI